MSENFVDVFNDELASIKVRAKRAGLSMNDLCRLAGVARVTPGRWRRQTPKTIDAVARLQGVLDAREGRAAAKN